MRKSEEEDATPDLLLKHPDATLATYKIRQIKHLQKALETHSKHTQHPNKTLTTYVCNICNIQINTHATYV